MKEILQKRLDAINSAIEQSINNHNQLVGHLDEVKYLIEECDKQEAPKEESKEEQAK